jgi:hypothetical protein
MQSNKVVPESASLPEVTAPARRGGAKVTTNWNDIRAQEMARAEENRKKIYRDFIEKANIFNQAGEILRYSFARLESGWCRQLSHRQLTQERKRSEILSFLSLKWCAVLTGIGFIFAVLDCEFEYQSSLLFCNGTGTYVRPSIAARDGLQCDSRVQFRAQYEGWQIYIRILNSAATLGLLLMLFVYHNCAIRVDYIRDPAFIAAASREAPSAFMLLLRPSFVLECLACAFHTAPMVSFSVTTSDVQGVKVTYSYQMLSVLWMGARGFVIVRFIKEQMLLMQRTPCIEILAGLAKIKLDTRFASKMWFNHRTLTRLVLMLISLIVYSAYCANVCDRPIVESQQLAFADSLWMIFITVATVGFGDIVPKTHCSRFMAGLAMVGGLGVTSLLVMFITKQILFSGTHFSLTCFTLYLHTLFFRIRNSYLQPCSLEQTTEQSTCESFSSHSSAIYRFQKCESLFACCRNRCILI